MKWNLLRHTAIVLCFSVFSAARANETTSYKYDALGRLVQSTTTGSVNNGLGVGTDYDPAGNRLAYTVTGASTIMGTSGDDILNGTANNDTIHGLEGNDLFYGHQGGDDSLYGGAGNDTFLFRTALSAADLVDGGTGNNIVVVQGNHPALVLGPNSMINVATMSVLSSQDNRFGGGSGSPSLFFSYNITWVDANVPAGATRTMNAAQIVAGDSVTFSSAAETDGLLRLFGGQGQDALTGGGGNDLLFGGLGHDRLTGNGGADTYQYNTATLSSGSSYDTLVGFNSQVDKIDLPGAVTTFGATVASGQLSSASFDADLAAAMQPLLAGQARLFTPSQGSLAGKTFLIADGNATAGYQAGADLVLEMESPDGTIAQTVAIFI